MDNSTKTRILDFLEMHPSGVIVIYWPTGCGKTWLSIEVANLINSEIISVDARQVYRGLDIGTGKITEVEKKWIPHHMLDVVDITESFSVVDYRKKVEELEIWKKMIAQNGETEGDKLSELDESGILMSGANKFLSPSGAFGTFHSWKVHEKGSGFPTKTLGNVGSTWNQGIPTEWQKYFPILCGGTWLYIDSLIYEREYMGEKPDTTRRDELELYRLEHGNQALWNILHDIDPTYANMLHVNNYTYIIRGIEVFEKTGKSKLEAVHGQKLLYPTLFITPYTDSSTDRQVLYTRINLRVKEMFKSWLVDEVWYNVHTLFWGNLSEASSCPGLVTIGYREVMQYLKWIISLDDCISLVQQHNRNYAKRQITWNKKYE